MNIKLQDAYKRFTVEWSYEFEKRLNEKKQNTEWFIWSKALGQFQDLLEGLYTSPGLEGLQGIGKCCWLERGLEQPWPDAAMMIRSL